MPTDGTEVQDTATEAVSNNDDLFGPSDGSEEVIETEQDPGTESSVSDDNQDAQEVETEQDGNDSDEGSEEEAEIELPQQQSKAYSDELTAEYARRFGYSLEEVKADKRLAYAIKSKIDSDIFIAQANAKLDALTETESEEETTQDAGPTATEAAVEPNAQYEQFISQTVERIVSPVALQKHGRAIAVAMLGTDPASIKDPKQRAEAEAFVERGTNMAKSTLTALADFVETYVPQRMEAYLESAMPGMSQERAVNESRSIWNEMRQANPDFAQFPEYGPQDGAFGNFIREHAAKIPNFDGMVINDPKTGRPLPRAEQVRAKYQLVAMAAASGKRPTTQMVKQAAESAKRQVEEQNAKKQSAKALGAGNSKAQLSQAKVTGNDDIFGSPGEFSSKRIGY